MAYTSKPFNYTGTLPNQVQNDLELANDNFDILGQAFIGNDPTNQPVKRAVYIGSTAPTDAVANTLWLDTSVNPPRLKVYDGTSWINFDADTIDGFHASQTPQAFTIPVAGSTGKLDAGWLPAVGNLNIVDFTSSGTWTVPSGVTKILIIATAGGGGGSGGYGTQGSLPSNGGNGGTTSIVGSSSGTLISLTGGGGGSGSGAPGVSYGVTYGVGSNGACSIFGRGGLFRSNNTGEPAQGYGAGGGGGYGGVGNGGGGGAGGYELCKVVSVISGETLTITIGAGGAGSAGTSYDGYAGGAGKSGFVRIIYFA